MNTIRVVASDLLWAVGAILAAPGAGLMLLAVWIDPDDLPTG